MSISKTSLNKSAAHPLQTSYWGKFRKNWGNEVLYTKYGLITIHRIPFTKHKVGMFIKGPVPTATLLNDLKKLAKQHNLIFIKLEPNVAVEFPNKSQSSNLNFKTKHTKKDSY